jgi:protein-tyrosine phosphatase
MPDYRRLPLEGLLNARDLGGYPVKNGGVTKYRQFIRCEAPRTLTERDVDILRDYGIKHSIDFRGDKEVRRQPSFLRGLDWVSYHRSPTFNEQVAFGAKAGSRRPPITSFVRWGEKYIEMTEDCGEWIRNTLELLAECEGAVMFNCTTGKDRTGIISALLLGLAGVSDEDIIADYCVSEVYLRPVYEELRVEFLKMFPSESAELTDPFFKTDPENMASLLRHINTKYGGVRAFTAACGLSTVAADKLHNQLIG